MTRSSACIRRFTTILPVPGGTRERSTRWPTRSIVGSRRRVEIIGWLNQQFPDWNLLLTVLSEAHSAGEIFWHGVADGHPLSRVPTAGLARQRLIEIYEEVDRAVAGIIAALPRGTRVLVTSVHGMETNDYDVPSMAILPELLYRASFGKPLITSQNAAAWKRSGSPAIVPAGDEKWSDYMRDRFGARPARPRLAADEAATGNGAQADAGA